MKVFLERLSSPFEFLKLSIILTTTNVIKIPANVLFVIISKKLKMQISFIKRLNSFPQKNKF